MEDTGLFFWLIVFAVAVLQGIGQKKRKPGQRGRRPSGADLPRRPGKPLETEEQEMSRPRPPVPVGSTEAEAEREDGSSEGMIPQDVWAEILGLARGEPKAESPPTPDKDPDADLVAMDEPLGAQGFDDLPQPERRSREFRPRDVRRSEVGSREVGREIQESDPPASGEYAVRRRREEVPRRLAESGYDADDTGDTARTQLFGAGSVKELRKAVILQEVLGPPVSLKSGERP